MLKLSKTHRKANANKQNVRNPRDSFHVLSISRSKRLYKNMLKVWFNVKQTLNFNLAISIHNNFCVLPKKKQNSLFVHTTWSSCLFYIYAKEEKNTILKLRRWNLIILVVNVHTAYYDDNLFVYCIMFPISFKL